MNNFKKRSVARRGGKVKKFHSGGPFDQGHDHPHNLGEGNPWNPMQDVEDVVPGVQLPNTWEEYLANLSKKNRHELKRKFTKI